MASLSAAVGRRGHMAPRAPSDPSVVIGKSPSVFRAIGGVAVLRCCTPAAVDATTRCVVPASGTAVLWVELVMIECARNLACQPPAPGEPIGRASRSAGGAAAARRCERLRGRRGARGR